eukprot:GHVP01042807.1.p1 GENE.GHVP01042807.1~~GHVP01042807.1.p1  ORF type:complete len:124 (-),score=32.87 GHVP01042807.1:2153-2524(-)
MDSNTSPLANETLITEILELVQTATTYGMIKKGANEATKALNKGRAELVVIAADTVPIEIIMHLPILCEDKAVPYVFIPEMTSLGRASGTSRPAIAVAILESEDEAYKAKLNRVKRGIDQIIK